MPANPVLSLQLLVAKPPETDQSWDSGNAGRSPFDLALFLQKILFVDAGEFAKLTGVIRQSGQPQPEDTNKLWIKTSEPIGVGVYSGGWQVIYEFTPHAPMLWDTNKRGPLPLYMARMTSSQMSGAGLTEPTDERWAWVTFNPPTFR